MVAVPFRWSHLDVGRGMRYNVRYRILVSTLMVYAVLLYVSPARAISRLSLMAIHTIRRWNILMSPFAQTGVVDGDTERAGGIL